LFNRVGAKYALDPVLLYAIAMTESGARAHVVATNKNGSVDHGAMQINSIHLPRLEKLGIQRRDLFDPCVNVDVGGWILAQCFQRWGVNWDGVGCYNSATEGPRRIYAQKVQARYTRLRSGQTQGSPPRSAAAPSVPVTPRYACGLPSGCVVAVDDVTGAIIVYDARAALGASEPASRP
jgi:hypothetical protein